MCSNLWTLNEICKFIELFTAVISTTRNDDTANIISFIEYRERATTGKGFFQFDKFHAETQIGLVTSEAFHSLDPCHLLQLRQFHSPDFLEEMSCHILKQVNDVILVNKAHFAIDLRKLRLPVGTQVLIPKALGNLEVTIEARHHQKLLQSLWTLGQSVELTRIHSAGHHEITGPLGRTAYKNRCFHLHEVTSVKEITYKDCHAMAQLQILSYGRAAQIQITILHPDIVATIGIVFYCERRRQAT